MQEGENGYHCSVNQRNCYWLQQALSVCLVLNKDFTRSKWYNHRISSGGKGFCKSLLPQERGLQSEIRAFRTFTSWILNGSCHSFSLLQCFIILTINSLSFYLIGASLDATWDCHPLSFCFGPDKGPVRVGRNQVWKSRWALCISRKLSSPSHSFFK